jgi:hypothetical protein
VRPVCRIGKYITRLVASWTDRARHLPREGSRPSTSQICGQDLDSGVAMAVETGGEVENGAGGGRWRGASSPRQVTMPVVEVRVEKL